jgi:hypothetical protein
VTEPRKGILAPGKTMDDYIGMSVINHSDLDLTLTQVKALSKGLSFCPTPWEPDMASIIANLDGFFRKMRLKSHFNNPEVRAELDLDPDPVTGTQNSTSQSITDFFKPVTHTPIWKNFRPKSTYTPPVQEDILENFCKQVKYQVLKTPVKKPKWSNLSKEERKGLTQIADNPNLVIKKADKGSAVVVMNTVDYLAEANRQLDNKEAYVELKEDPTAKYCEDIQKILDRMLERNVINKKCHKFLSPTDCRPGRFYLLPKIHKAGVPGRPICSSVGHPTENISKFVDAHIRRFMQGGKSYIRDTQDFIKRINDQDPLPQGALLVTLDVTSL